MQSAELLNDLRDQNNELRQLFHQLQNYGSENLTITPAEGGWNVVQCVDHMNKATELYLDQIEQKLPDVADANQSRFNPAFLASYFSKMLAPAHGGEIKHKMKTLKPFIPSESLSSLACLERFGKNLDRFEAALEKLEGKNLRSFKVVTALGPILKFYVGDAMKFIHAHNLRHAQQIRNIINATVTAKTA